MIVQQKQDINFLLAATVHVAKQFPQLIKLLHVTCVCTCTCIYIVYTILVYLHSNVLLLTCCPAVRSCVQGNGSAGASEGSHHQLPS